MLLAATIAEFCRRLAPRDLASAPAYAVLQSGLPADRGGASKCWGFTSPNLDLQLRDLIGDEWQGRGAAMVLNDTLAESFNAYPAHARDLLNSIAIHELAHCLERRRLFYGLEDSSPAEIAAVALAVAGEVAADRPADAAHHGPPFLRIAVHLLHRAEAIGVDVFPRVALGGYRGRYAGFKAYFAALAGEPARMIGEPFGGIRNEPMPAAFIELWQADTGRTDWTVHP